MILFCVFCGSDFPDPGSWGNHMKDHFQQRGQSMTREVKDWIHSFYKSQRDPFRVRTSLPALIRSYADCIVCRHFRGAGYKGRTQHCRFQKGSKVLEDHLRSHLCYKAFSCLICSQPDDKYEDTVIEWERSKEGRYFIIWPADRPVKKRMTTRRSVITHIRNHHLTGISDNTASAIMTDNPVSCFEVGLQSCIAFSPLEPLESLVQSAAKIHHRNLKAIRAVKKNKDTEAEAVKQLKPDVSDKIVGIVDRIRMQPEKSYFNISLETDEMLNDIDEVLASQNDNRFSQTCEESDYGVDTPVSQSSEYSDSSPSTMSNYSKSVASLRRTPRYHNNPSQMSPSVASTPWRPVRRKELVSRSSSSASPSDAVSEASDSSCITPVARRYSTRSSKSSISVAPLSRPRPPPRNRNAAGRSVRRLNFDAMSNVMTRNIRRVVLSDEMRNHVRFANTVDRQAEGTRTVVEEPHEMTIILPYNTEIQDRVDEIIQSFVHQTQHLHHLSGQSVADILCSLSDCDIRAAINEQYPGTAI